MTSAADETRRNRRSPVQSRWFCGGISTVAALVSTAALLHAADERKPVLELDVAFSADACCSWQVWVGEPTTENITVLPMQWGRSATYSVPLQTGRIVQLRMPLGDAPGSRITIREIRVTVDSKTVDTVTPAELQAITPFDARKREVRDGISIEATGTHPFLDARVDLDARTNRLVLLSTKILSQPLGALVALLAAGAFALVPFATRSRQQLPGAAALAVTVVGVYALPSLLARISFHDDVSESVGFASYVGIPKQREQLLLSGSAALAVVVPLLAAGAIFFVRRRRGTPPPASPADDTEPDRPHELSRLVAVGAVAAPVLVAALVGAPRLHDLIGSGRTVEYLPNWDSNNFIFWKYLVEQTDLVPIKDFVWVYGMQWLFDLSTPWGETLAFLTHLAIWTLLAVGSWLTLSRFFGGRELVGRFFALSSLWVVALLAGYVTFDARYSAALAVLLLYAAVRPDDALVSARRVLFALAFTGLILFEVAHAIYAIVPIALLLMLEVATEVERSRPAVRDWLVRSAATVGVPLLAAVAAMAALGTLGNTAFYYGQLQALTVSFAYPAHSDLWARHPAYLAGFLFWCVPIVIALGTLAVFHSRGRPRRVGGVVLALGLLGFMVMQKQFIRPDVSGQIWLPVVFGLPFWAVTETTLAGRRRWAAVGAVAGAGAALVLVTGGLRAGWEKLEVGPGRLASSIGALAHQRDEFAFDADARYAPKRFVKFPRHAAVAAALLQIPAVRSGGDVWVLGDDTPITMLLGHNWPYYFFDLYDASPIAFQRRVLDRLEAAPPVRAVWNYAPEAAIFDSVPQVVRSPLLFEWTIRNWVPERELQQFAILRPRRAGEPPAIRWWRVRLGKNINLGHIPRHTEISSEPCSRGLDCRTYLLVEPPPGTTLPDQVVATVQVGGREFEVQFATRKEGRRYAVDLDRVWFWTVAPPGAARVLLRGVPGTRTEIVRRRQRPDVLY